MAVLVSSHTAGVQGLLLFSDFTIFKFYRELTMLMAAYLQFRAL